MWLKPPSVSRMKTADDMGAHSRSSSETNIPDVEKGEVRPPKEEEEVLEKNVCSEPSNAALNDKPLVP